MNAFVPDDSAPAQESGVGTIRRRHVLYVEGYDPLGTQWYFDLFRRTCERFQRIWPLTIAVQPLEIDSADFAHWGVDLRGPNWQTAARCEFLRLERFIRSDMARPTPVVVLRGLWWHLGDVLTGTQLRIYRASWRFALHLSCFQWLLLAWIAAAAAIGLIVGYGIEKSVNWPVPAMAVAAMVAALAALFALRPIAGRVVQINSSWALLRKFARSRPTWLDRAIDIGAWRVVAVARSTDADEIAVVGHSSGCVTACAIVARALELDPDLGKSGPRLVLLTLGSVMPAVALHPAAQRMRAIVGRLATAKNLAWVDCRSGKHEDVMCFADFDPVAGIGVHVAAERCNPMPWQVRFKEMFSPQQYARIRTNYFRMHYQYLMAGDRPAPYDYILLVCGPMPIAEWPKRDRELMETFGRNGIAADARCSPAVAAP